MTGVRLILDKELRPDIRWDGRTVRRILQDATGEVSGDPLDRLLFGVELDSGGNVRSSFPVCGPRTP